ncbi:eCIS core domain-containing protein [Saccharopolyspora spinosa]|uniref:Uncharacterized protein DUF4157 n=1 Tax=Saccharopolyspora spinosa TaxID=60894 RepID=A0A2N3Y6P0_SACSN|nr:DUF4157 domain-containing protein [Saccharopolyspora spinosa]PKW18541.1 uncharacterized protein DUF4157 [Saccharopolyspora spinosa]
MHGEVATAWILEGTAGGVPLEAAVQAEMERLFAADFSGIRVCHDAEADLAARRAGAARPPSTSCSSPPQPEQIQISQWEES